MQRKKAVLKNRQSKTRLARDPEDRRLISGVRQRQDSVRFACLGSIVRAAACSLLHWSQPMHSRLPPRCQVTLSSYAFGQSLMNHRYCAAIRCPTFQARTPTG